MIIQDQNETHKNDSAQDQNKLKASNIDSSLINKFDSNPIDSFISNEQISK